LSAEPFVDGRHVDLKCQGDTEVAGLVQGFEAVGGLLPKRARAKRASPTKRAAPKLMS